MNGGLDARVHPHVFDRSCGFFISQETGRIDIDRDTFPWNQGAVLSAFEQKRAELSRVLCKHQDLYSMAPPNPADRTGRGLPEFHSRYQQGPQSGDQFGAVGSAPVYS